MPATVTERPIVSVCTLVAEVPRPGMQAVQVPCCACSQPVWLLAATVLAVVKLGRTEVLPICTTCFPQLAPVVHAVLTSDALDPADAGERARQLGVAADTPVVNVDRVHRA